MKYGGVFFLVSQSEPERRGLEAAQGSLLPFRRGEEGVHCLLSAVFHRCTRQTLVIGNTACAGYLEASLPGEGDEFPPTPRSRRASHRSVPDRRAEGQQCILGTLPANSGLGSLSADQCRRDSMKPA